MAKDISNRLTIAKGICLTAGTEALGYFKNLGSLKIERKSHQDLVSQADKNVELLIRAALADAFPDDGIVGEEHDDVVGNSGFTWVIDPIDGTANFVVGIPAWVVVLACVKDDRTVLGVIYDPNQDQLYWAEEGGGAFVNDKPMKVAETKGLHDGTVGIGLSNHTPKEAMVNLIGNLLDSGGKFCRLATGALSLCYVASGKFIGYSEYHMNAWDCIAGQLLIVEAGGLTETQSIAARLQNGGRVIAGSPIIFDELQALSLKAFESQKHTSI